MSIPYSGTWNVARFALCGAIAVCALLSGCNRMALLVKPEPYDARIAAECNLPCDPPLDLTGNTADELLAVSKVNRAYLARCTVRRDACAAALDRLKQAKVIQ